MTSFLAGAVTLADAGVGLSVWRHSWWSYPRLEDVLSDGACCAHCARVVSQLTSAKICFGVAVANVVPVLTTEEIIVSCQFLFL